MAIMKVAVAVILRKMQLTISMFSMVLIEEGRS